MRYSASPSPLLASAMRQTVVDAQAHPIEAVTVYMFRAEVRRIITLALQEGRNDFAIVNLPSSIAPDTVHVAGLSAGQASIVDTTCVVPSQPQAAIRSNVERVARKVAELQAAKRELLRELSLINARSDVLLAYARSLSGENTEPTDFVNFLTQFNAAGEVTLHASTRIEAAVRDLDDRINKITSNNSLDEDGDEPMDPELKTKASVVISAKEACTVKLSLTYVVNKASWNPAYKLHATTDTKTHAVASTAVLHYCASITQTTGEDWNDVRLTLSTRGSSGIQGTPSLQRSLIRAAGAFGFGNNHPGHKPQNFAAGVAASMHAPAAATSLFGESTAATSSFGFGGFGQGSRSISTAHRVVPASTYTSTAAGGHGLFGSEPTEPHVHQLDDGADLESTVIVESDPELRELEHVGAAATEQALSCTYSIETNVTIHTGDTPHRVTMMTIPLGVKTDYVAVPKVTPLVYLLCKFTNTSTHQFLPGSLVTYLDDSYVDTVPIPFVPVRGAIIKSLGTDTALSISFNQTRRKADANYPTTFAHKKTTVVTDIITLRNSRSTTIPRVLVRHAVPVPDDSRFRVTIKEPEALGELALGKDLELRDRVRGRWMDSAQTGSDVSGRLEWAIDDVPAHATEEIKMVYEVAAPEDVNWSQT